MRQKLFYYYQRYGFFMAAKAVLYYIKTRSIHTFAALNIAFHDHPWDTPPPPHHQRSAKFRILFLTFSYQSDSKRYRINHIMEYLKIAGIESAVLYVDDLAMTRNYALHYDIIVLFRLTLNERLRQFISDAKRSNIPVVYSTDDFLFDAETIEQYARLPSDVGVGAMALYREEAQKQQAAIQLCDYFLGSTDALAAQSETVGKPSFVIHNGLNQEWLDISARVAQTKVKRSTIVIGYFSGTKTHDRDFTVAENALVRVLNEYPAVTLSIVGWLKLGDAFQPFKKRINRSLVPWWEMPKKIADVDINIAPLEMGNPIVESKSELKYFEAGIVKVPTIASATDSYRYAITSGENGLLAYNDDDWYRHLRLLIKNEHLRQSMGENAYQHTLRHYAPRPMSQQTKAVFEEIYDR